MNKHQIIDYSLKTRYEILLTYWNSVKLDYSFLLHMPNNGAIKYLMQGWEMVLNYMGIKTYTVDVGNNAYKLDDFLERNNVKVFITCADEYYLNNVDSDFLKESGVLIGHMSSQTNEIYRPVDFLIDFSINENEPNEREGIPLKRIRFGCNPIIHYCTDLSDNLDYYYVGTNSGVKFDRTSMYLSPIIDRYEGLLMGRGYNKTCKELDIASSCVYYSQAIISPNYHTQGQIDNYININERAYIIPACGGFQVVDHPKPLLDVFNKDEIVYADTIEKYHDHVDYFIEHPEERFEYIYKGMKRVYEDYTLFDSMTELYNFTNSILR